MGSKDLKVSEKQVSGRQLCLGKDLRTATTVSSHSNNIVKRCQVRGNSNKSRFHIYGSNKSPLGTLASSSWTSAPFPSLLPALPGPHLSPGYVCGLGGEEGRHSRGKQTRASWSLSRFNKHVNHLATLLKCRFSFSVGHDGAWRFSISNELPGDYWYLPRLQNKGVWGAAIQRADSGVRIPEPEPQLHVITEAWSWAQYVTSLRVSLCLWERRKQYLCPRSVKTISDQVWKALCTAPGT